MLFNSTSYLLLLLVSVGGYWLLRHLMLRQVLVFVASLYFYMSWSRTFTLVLLVLIAANWGLGFLVQKSGQKKWLVAGCFLNLGLLACFKYFNFLAENLATLLGWAGQTVQPPHMEILLPLGISFYVFELISYLVDVYKGRFKHEKNPLVFAIFVLFFPHLIAGPICRASQLIPQLHVQQRFNAEAFYNGCYLFLAGFCLKCGLADGVAPYVNVIFATPAQYSGLDNLLGTVGFGVQILCDFWGYSLMALGSALLFGYVLPANFNMPYAAVSIRDFWRRWHMTLSAWLRDYLYIALGGSREKAEWKIYRNLLITMLLGGLWHGASWNFVIWGGMHGAALAVHRWFEGSPSIPQKIRAFFSWPPLAWLLTMAMVFGAWIFFRAPHLETAWQMLVRIFTPEGWLATRIPPVFFELLLLYLPLQWLIHRTTYDYNMAQAPVRWQMPAVALLSIFALVYYVNGADFIYFRF